jgi:hypothetical protein
MYSRASGTHLSGQGSSEGDTCPHGSGSHLLAQGSSRAATCRLGSNIPPPGAEQLRECHMSPRLQL